MRKIVVGILAHVDAGKTTLSEMMLYKCGSIRKLGRVDHNDTFLDYDVQERDRGITIYSKQASLEYKDLSMTFLDTPGHTDFSSEMERTLQVLDYALLIISSLDGVTAHTETIFKLLNQYHIPTFVFVNKMDYNTTSKEEVLSSLNTKLNGPFIDMFNGDQEELSLVNEALLNEYIENNTLSTSSISNAINQRDFYPVYFGSALKDQGVEDLLEGLYLYTTNKSYDTVKQGLCYKVMHDKNERLTWIKVLGGSYSTKDVIKGEKIHQIRIYNGLKYEVVDTLNAGEIGTLVGLDNIEVGDYLESDAHNNTLLKPYLHYHLSLPKDCNELEMTQNILKLASEDPTLNIEVIGKDIQVSLMGEIQIEVLTKKIKDLYNVDVTFDQGKIRYLETINSSFEGVGHFEPLRHYAEVHLLLEPGERGSGIEVIDASNHLERHYVRSIMRYCYRGVPGVLGGYPITDIKITVLGGKSHIKHTEGGDFREATIRALRQGLMQCESTILEPYYHFSLTVPNVSMSKALYDLDLMHASFKVTSNDANTLIIGKCPISSMRNYTKEVINYTKGQGKLVLEYAGYDQLADEKSIDIHYDPHKDERYPTGSVFCKNGAGYYVPYNEVENYMHVPYYTKKEKGHASNTTYVEEDLNQIFERTYGKVNVRLSDEITYNKHNEKVEVKENKPICLLVDGYNVIGASESLKTLSNESLDSARSKLLDLVGNYQGYVDYKIIVVFDAYKVKGNIGEEYKEGNLYVVYTKEAQTADAYIERSTKELAKNYQVYVATSDQLEQTIILGNGAYRISSREFLNMMENVTKSSKEEFERKQEVSRNFLFEDLKKLIEE